jgi:hypothetical protein
MKIIEALKGIKDLNRKAEDLRKLIAVHCADLDYETPRYDDQWGKVQGWIQAHGDIVKEILRLKFCIMKTNIATKVDVELGGKIITKTIAEWIYRRKDLAKLDLQCWNQLGDRNLKEGQIPQSDGSKRDVKIRRYYKSEERDEKISLFKSEPLLIDAKLEVANCVTDLIED